MVGKNIVLILGVLTISLILVGTAQACSTCSNGHIDYGEQCDGPNLSNATCASVMGSGWAGTLKCSSSCTFNTSSCVPTAPTCGNNILETGEQCDNGSLNGAVPWTPYGTSNTYCTTSCKIKIITNFCGDGIKQSCEQCDDGNTVNGDGCSSSCVIETPQLTCNADVAVRYSYGNSFGTGIAINGTDWINGNPANLSEGDYKIRFYIDNNENSTQNTNVTLKLDGNILTNYYVGINSYTYNTINLSTTGLCGLHTISLEAHPINATDCDTNDNSASRQIYISCETPVLPICGDGIINQANETCDGSNFGGQTCSSLGYDKGTLSCSSSCTIDASSCENNPPSPPVVKSSHSMLTYINYTECVPKWECSGWSECSNGIMTRTCQDVNNCDYKYNKPLESSVCTMSQSLVGKTTGNHTGLFITAVLVFILLILVLINLKK